MQTQTQDNLPTVEELNYIQFEWMQLDPFAPEPEKKRVFAMMRKYPRIYVSGHDGNGVCMIDGQPWTATAAFADAMRHCKEFGGRTDIAWNGCTGKWYAI